MKFNYRVCFRPSTSPTHHIHEVYYDDRGRVAFYDPKPAVGFGDDKDEMYECAAAMDRKMAKRHKKNTLITLVTH